MPLNTLESGIDILCGSDNGGGASEPLDRVAADLKGSFRASKDRLAHESRGYAHFAIGL